MPSPLVSHYRSAAKRSKDRSPSRIGSRKWRISLRLPSSLVSSDPSSSSLFVVVVGRLRGSSFARRETNPRPTDHSRFSSGWSRHGSRSRPTIGTGTNFGGVSSGSTTFHRSLRDERVSSAEARALVRSLARSLGRSLGRSVARSFAVPRFQEFNREIDRVSRLTVKVLPEGFGFSWKGTSAYDSVSRHCYAHHFTFVARIGFDALPFEKPREYLDAQRSTMLGPLRFGSNRETVTQNGRVAARHVRRLSFEETKMVGRRTGNDANSREFFEGSSTARPNRSFPRPSRWSAVRGLESSASRVHGAHRYRRR